MESQLTNPGLWLCLAWISQVGFLMNFGIISIYHIFRNRNGAFVTFDLFLFFLNPLKVLFRPLIAEEPLPGRSFFSPRQPVSWAHVRY